MANNSAEKVAGDLIREYASRDDMGRLRSAIATAITTAQRPDEAQLRTLIINSQKPHGKCYWGLGFMFSPDTMKEDCEACAAKRQMIAIANGTDKLPPAPNTHEGGMNDG